VLYCCCMGVTEREHACTAEEKFPWGTIFFFGGSIIEPTYLLREPCNSVQKSAHLFNRILPKRLRSRNAIPVATSSPRDRFFLLLRIQLLALGRQKL
jgi:hypothetical protein